MLKIYRVEDTEDGETMYISSRFEPEVIDNKLTFHLGPQKGDRSTLSFKSWGEWKPVELWDIPRTATIWGNMTIEEIGEIYTKEARQRVRKAKG